MKCSCTVPGTLSGTLVIQEGQVKGSKILKDTKCSCTVLGTLSGILVIQEVQMKGSKILKDECSYAVDALVN